MRKTKTFVSKGYSETSVPTIVYKDDCEPCAVYVNGERQNNISYIPKVNEGVSSVQYKSEYKNNLRTLQIEGNTNQDVYGGYNLFDIDAVTGITDDVGNSPSSTFGTITDGVMHLKYGLYYHSTYWLGAKIPIRQGGNYYISCDVLIEEASLSPRIYASLKNVSKNANLPYIQSNDIVKGAWTRYTFPAQAVPDTWVGDEVYLMLNARGMEDQYLNIPIYAKNVMVTYENNLYDISKVNGAANSSTTNPNVAGDAQFGTVSDGVLHLKYGMYANGVVWTGAKIPIKQGGNYYVSADIFIDSSIVATHTRMNLKLKNYTKQTATDWQFFYSTDARDTWFNCSFNATPIPDDWVGDDVYLVLQTFGDKTQYSNLPVYAKNIMISYGEAKPYQPYGGNVPYEPYYGGTGYPSIKYPQAITNCGNGQIEVVARGANEFDISKVKVTPPNTTHPYISSVTENSITITTPKNVTSNGYRESQKRLYELCPNIKIGTTYKLVFKKPSNTRDVIYLTAGVYWRSGTAETITEAMFNSVVVFYGYNGPASDTPISVTLSDFMITEAEDAEYEPYFNSSVSIPANVVLESGANETLLELAKIGDIADTITIDRVNNEVKYIQRICRVRPFVSVGGTMWYDSYTSQYYNVDLWEFDLDKYTNTGVMKCEFAKVAPITEAETEFCVEMASDSSMYMGFPKSLGITTRDAIENYLMQTGNFGLSIFYVLEEPIEWTITDNMGYTVNLKKNLLEWAKNTKNQTNIIEITSTPSVTKTSINYAKWGGSNEV